MSSKVWLFLWLVYQGKVLTHENLKKKGVHMVSTCALCTSHEELIARLFLYCPFALTGRDLLLSRFGRVWVMLAEPSMLVEE